MRRLLNIKLIICFILLSIQFTHAQQERKDYDAIAIKVQANFNADQSERIYQLTSAIFQKKMTGEQFARGMARFRTKVGDWKKNDFKEKNEKGFDYIALFENSKQIFSLKLNAEGKIDRLNFAATPIIIANKTEKQESNNPLKDSTDLWVEQKVRSYIQKGNTAAITLAVIQNGKIRTYSYGSTSKITKQLPSPETTIFEIGSVTKTFNALVLAQEVIAGRMKLSDPINSYLPDSIPTLQFQNTRITLENLANHTSGLPRLPANIFSRNVDPKDPYKHYLTDALYSFLKHYQPTVKPGTLFSYSNFGAGVLSTILERNTNCSFEQIIVTRICKPLKMNNTSISLSPIARKNFAQGYNEAGEATAPWDLAALKGSGAIRSTLSDMVKYTMAQMNISNTTPFQKAIILSHQTTFKGKEQDMGLGWRINHNKGNTYFHHSGGTGGFRSFVGFDLNRQRAIVILSNAADDVTNIGEDYLQTNNI
ncbi:serine hydrolase [Pedobacter sp. ASV1-7]|uniref:serine hydrolase n=1 Tax=Pedobacter sp. ASV1-7 TaxID=3145237 RepID=UPI0032E85D9D